MAHLLDQFQKIYIINLATRRDRRAEIRVQLERVGSGLDRHNVELFEAVRPESAGSFPSIGARGCFMSHLQILQKSVESGLDRILILEDDLDFSHDFREREQAAVAALQNMPWSLFYGGYRLLGGAAPPAGVGEIEPEFSVGCTHFMGFQGAGIGTAAKYLAAMADRSGGDPAGGPMHVDGAYAWLRKAHPELRTWMAVPELGHQRPSRTDIHDLSWYDRVIGLRSVATMIRKSRL